MKIILLGALLASAASLGGCASEESKQAKLRTTFAEQCRSAVASQGSQGINGNAVCDCVAQAVLTGKSASEMEHVLGDESAVSRATATCVGQQMQGANAGSAPAVANNTADAVERAADRSE